MNRRTWIKISGANTLGLMGFNLINTNLTDALKQPVLFIGHGSPMNAIEDNVFSREMKRIGKQLYKPNLILVISAHWETKGNFLTATKQPETLHDFVGFPEALFNVRYPAQGHPEFVERVCQKLSQVPVHPDYHWGFDHGAWSVLRNMFPEAQVPVVQMSLNTQWTARQHFEFAQELKFLRNQGVLIIGSGNMVHNFSTMAFDVKHPYDFNVPYAHDWATEANHLFKTWIVNRNSDVLSNYLGQQKSIRLAVPTPEHYLPLLYIMGLLADDETPEFFNDSIVAGSFSMTSFISKSI